MHRVMLPETENLQEAKSDCPGKHARHAWLIRVDTLRRVHNVGFHAKRFIYKGKCLKKKTPENAAVPPTVVCIGKLLNHSRRYKRTLKRAIVYLNISFILI